MRSVGLTFVTGDGILAHPGGPAAGLASLREGWEAAVSNIPLESYAHDHPALAQALAAYA